MYTLDVSKIETMQALAVKFNACWSLNSLWSDTKRLQAKVASVPFENCLLLPTFFSEFFTSLKYFISPNVICTLCWAEVLRIRCKLSLFFFTKHRILSGSKKNISWKFCLNIKYQRWYFLPINLKKILIRFGSCQILTHIIWVVWYGFYGKV